MANPKAVATTLKKYGKDYYANIGMKGGSAPHKGKRGFAADKERASRAGKIGGRISKRRAA